MTEQALTPEQKIEIEIREQFATELAAIDRQKTRFLQISVATLIISVVHVAAAMMLYTGASLFEQAVAIALTFLVDWVSWSSASYLDYAKQRNLSRKRWIWVLFSLTLAISGVLNFAYLWTHRPPESVMPWWFSLGYSLTFSFFIPGTIAIAAVISGELQVDRDALLQKMNDTKRDLLAKAEGKTKARVTISKPASSPLQRAIESENHLSLPAPDESAALQSAGGKAAIATSDAMGIRNALREHRLSVVKSAEQLRRCCGAESSSSGPRYLRTALESGILSPLESGGYQVLSVD